MEGTPGERADLRMAMICCAVMGAAGEKCSPADFMPRFGEDEQDSGMDEEDARAMIDAYNRSAERKRAKDAPKAVANGN
jgi:hypothetical protein